MGDPSTSIIDTLVGGNPNRSRVAVIQPRASIPGAYPDRTVLPNFHSTSERRCTIVETFRCPCSISTGDRYLFTINDTPNPNLVFPESIRAPITAKRTASGPQESIYKIDEVWIIVEDQNQPLLADVASFTDRSVKCTTRFLSGSIGTSYVNNTAIYNVTFVRVGITEMFFGTIAGAVARQPNGKYTATLKTKFPTSSLIPLPSAVYLRMMYQAEDGKWKDYVPKVQGSPNPLKTGTAMRKKHETTNQYVPGEVSFAPVTTDGYVEYIVEDLPGDTKFSAFISNVSNSPNFVSLVRDKNDTSSRFYLVQAATIPQPERPCTFRTPPDPTSTDVIRVMAYSCVDGLLTPFKYLQRADAPDYHFKVGNGDNYYQDSSETKKDFTDHYDGLWRNDAWQYMAVTGGNYFMWDDHEVRDGYDTDIVFLEGNAAQFRLTAEQAALYDQIMANPALRPYIVFTRAANDGLKTSLVSNDKIADAYAAFDTVFPAMPHTADHVSRNWSERWGSTLALFVNSKPYLNNDGSVDYWKRRARVSTVGGAPVIDWTVPPGQRMNQFIPAPGMQYIKDTLLADKRLPGRSESAAKLIFFSSNVTPNYTAARTEFLNKLIQISATLEGFAPPYITPIAGGLFDKLWLQRRADKADLTSNPDVLELVQWFKNNDIKNVIFVTGDPHNSTIQYLDRENVIVEACLSTVGNYRSNSVTATFMGRPDNDDALANVVENSWGDISIDAKERIATIRVMGEHGPLSVVPIELARR